MEDLNTRTESVIGDASDENKGEDQSKGQMVIGDPQVDDEPEDLRAEQVEEEELEPPLEPDDPE